MGLETDAPESNLQLYYNYSSNSFRHNFLVVWGGTKAGSTGIVFQPINICQCPLHLILLCDRLTDFHLK